MADYENIKLTQPNFCLGPLDGTFCTINLENPHTTLLVKNSAGANILELTLSSNIVSNYIKLEYVGPHGLSSFIDGLTFFTFERVNSTKCIIKRWETRVSFSELLLKEEVIKYSTGYINYNSSCFAVEYYTRTSASDVAYTNYIDINNSDYIKTGTKLFIGPSSDHDNLGSCESATVVSVSSFIGRKRLYLNKNLTYQYRSGDSITFYNNIYVFSEDGYGGDPKNGSIIKIDAYNWGVDSVTSYPIYKKITVARWCPYINGIATIVGLNMLFIMPYNSYYNWRSMFLNNVAANDVTVFPVYDVVFDDYTAYKLQPQTTLRDDLWNKIDYVWDTYNYQEDSLLPYSSSVVTYMNKSLLIGLSQETEINLQVRDQYNIALRGVDVAFYKDGDPGASFDPEDGLCTTDVNGEASIGYVSGSSYENAYEGFTEITTKIAGGSVSSTGSQYVWNSNNIITNIEYSPLAKIIYQLKEKSGDVMLELITSTFKSIVDDEYVFPSIKIFCKSYFTTPGGDWGIPGQTPGEFIEVSEVAEWLPRLYRGDGLHKDAPAGDEGEGYGFDPWPYPDEFLGTYIISNQIKQVNVFSSELKIKELTNFFIYEQEEEMLPYFIIHQKEGSNSLQLSQLKLSFHTHWVDGENYDYLWTHEDIDQFVFIGDAIPKFWSEKNPKITNIWLRLRPFAFDLENSTLRMWVREYSYLGDTGYYEVTSSLNLENFDAGGGLLGIEVLYNPPVDFKHNSIVFVRLEVYDTAPTPHRIFVEYWFKVVPDYGIPYLSNMSPDNLDINVDNTASIYFEIHDDGAGINLDTLEVLLNSVRVDTNYLTVEEVSENFVKVTYTPPRGLNFNKEYRVGVKVEDSSENKNLLNDSYVFYTAPSSGVFITDISPGFCKKGMSLFQEVRAMVLADGSGVDRGSLRMQVMNKDVNPNIVPIVYRVE